MKLYICDDRTEGYNQLDTIEAENINDAVEQYLTTEFNEFPQNRITVDVVDDVHAWIVINLPGGAKHEYEVGEIGK